MNQYYLMSQLPSLDAVTETSQLPITEERFTELCGRFLSKKALKALNELTIIPSRKKEKSDFPIVNEWNDGERTLRLALGNIRAGKLKKEFDTENKEFPIKLLQAAHTAAEMTDPLEAERFLNGYRLGFLETLRPMDAFCEASVFYYAIKLKLLSRMKQFDGKIGQEKYRNIYNSIMNGELQEAAQ